MFNFAGGMLTGAEIERQIKKGNISITPYDPGCVNPNSYNLKLHPQLLIYKRDANRANVLKQKFEAPNSETGIVLSRADKTKLDGIISADQAVKDDGFTIREEDTKWLFDTMKDSGTPVTLELLQELLNKQRSEIIEELKSINLDKSQNKSESENHTTEDSSSLIVDTVATYPDTNTAMPNQQHYQDRASILIIKNRIDDLEDNIGDIADEFGEMIDKLKESMDGKIDRLQINMDSKMEYFDNTMESANTKIHEDRNRLSHLEKLPNNDSYHLPPLDMKSKNETIEITIPEEGFVLQPGVLYIGRTVERTWTDKFIPMINGRSSGGRLGISIHICAGFGDIGFDGTWTLEITVVEPVRIYPNTEIAQVCYFKPCGKAKKLYRGRYHGQTDATASRFYKPKEN